MKLDAEDNQAIKNITPNTFMTISYRENPEEYFANVGLQGAEVGDIYGLQIIAKEKNSMKFNFVKIDE